MDILNATDARVSRTFHNNPLLHLIFAASILSKLAHGKAYLQSPWVPFRPLFGYYPHPQQQISPLWYPINPFLLPSRLFPQLTTNVPQIQQSPPLNQQQIIHIHEPPQQDFEDYDDSRTKYPQAINPYQDQLDPSNPSGSNLDEQTALEQQDNTEIILSPSNSDDTLITENATYNEIPEPPTPYGKPIIESDLEAANSDLTVVTVLPDMLVANRTDEIEDILVAAEANNYKRRQRPQNYDYDYEEDDFVGSQIRRPKPTRSQNRPQKLRPYKQQGARINSKRGQYRPLTTPYPVYDDDYDQTTPRANRRRPTQNKYRRRTTTPVYDDDEYETRPYNNKRKNHYNNRYGNRRPPSGYSEYYDENDEAYENDDIEEYSAHNRDRPSKPRQEATSEAATTTESTTETTTTEAATKPTTSSTTANTTVGYPYNNGNNVSSAYGPPNYHPGYGPSNGNEQISITYGPPTGPHIGPLLDSWYNQYAKTSVIKRIQELLTPNSYYSPQYDIDKFNYNDDSF